MSKREEVEEGDFGNTRTNGVKGLIYKLEQTEMIHRIKGREDASVTPQCQVPEGGRWVVASRMRRGQIRQLGKNRRLGSTQTISKGNGEKSVLKIFHACVSSTRKASGSKTVRFENRGTQGYRSRFWSGNT